MAAAIMKWHAVSILGLLVTPGETAVTRGALFWSPTALYWTTPAGPPKKLATDLMSGYLGIAGTGETMPRLSPDFSRAAYIATDYSLWVLPISGGPAKKVSRGCSPATPKFSPTLAVIYGWSSDSRKLFFSQIPRQLGGFDAPVDPRPFDPSVRHGRFVYDLSTDSIEEVADFKRFKDWLAPKRFSESPNGKQSLLSRRAGAGPDDPRTEWVLKRGLLGFGSVIHTVGAFNADPSWLDDRYLYYLHLGKELRFFDVETSRVTIFRPEEPSKVVPAGELWPGSEPAIDPNVAQAAAAQEKEIQELMQAIRSALSKFYMDTRGRYPNSLSELIPKYIESIPSLNLAQHGRTKGVIEVSSNAGPSYQKHLSDSGKWLYISDSSSPMFGTLVIDCSHRPSHGLVWHSR